MSLSLYLFLLALWLQGVRDDRRDNDLTQGLSWVVVGASTIAFVVGK